MAESRLDVVVRGKDELSPELKRIESSVIRAVGAISASLAAIKIGSAPIVAAAQFEQEMANVAKTTDFTAKSLSGGVGELTKLSDALLQMSLRVNVAAVDLAKIAAAAGQLGFADKFGVDGVIAFTDSVSRMASVLDITAEKAATDLGKIINIFKTPVRDIEKAISIVNEVSNKSTASGEELLDVIKRIGDAAGSLNLGQSAALAATGIDFGLSPEVVGTGFSKAFSAMREDADKFGRVVKGIVLETGEVMDGSAKQWIETVEENGITALKTYLQGLRKLDAQSQQQAIVKLVGGGRIGALFNKLVQDASNSVLDNALKAQEEGSLGVSALKEQATVMFTLSSQAQILRNSLFKLGTDSAGAFLPQLAQLTAQLSAALQTPQVRSFVNAVVGGFTDLITEIGAVVSFVGNLNVNWENFIRVLKVFLEIKLAQTLLGLASNIKVFGASLKSISQNAEAAAVATKKVGKAAQEAAAAEQAAAAGSVKGWLLRATGLDEVLAKTKQYNAAVAAQKAAEATSGSLKKASLIAAGQASSAGITATNTGKAVEAVSGETSKRRAALEAAQKTAAEAEIARSTAKAARIEQAEAASAARRQQIETAYQTRRQAIVATGTETGMKALRAEKARQLTLDAETHTRSLRSIDAYYAKRAAVQQAALAAEMQRATAALAQQTAVEATIRKASTNAQAGGAAAGAGAVAAAAAAAAAAATAEKLKVAAEVAKKSLFSIGTAVRWFGTILATAGRLIMGAFVWITVLYSIADATGLVDKLGPAFQKFTDFLGFTSKAARDAKVATEEAATAAGKAAAEFEKSADAYKKFIDAGTGKLDRTAIDGRLEIARNSADPAQQRQAAAELIRGAQGGVDVIADAEGKVNVDFTQRLKALQAELDTTQAKVVTVTTQMNKALTITFPEADKAKIREQYEKVLGVLGQQIDTAKEKINEFTQSQKDAGQVAKNTGVFVGELGVDIATMFTQESAQAAVTFLEPIFDIIKQADAIRAESEAAQNAFANAPLGAGKEAAKRVLDETVAKLLSLGLAEKEAREELAEFIKTKSKLTGIDPAILNSFTALQTIFAALPTKELGQLITRLQATDPKSFTGANVPLPAPKKTGVDKVNLKGESKKDREHKLALARLELIKADLEAVNQVQDEADKQLLDKQKDAFDRGLISIRDYYAERQLIQEAGIQRDVLSKEAELEAVNLELANAEKEVDRIRFTARVLKLEGEIEVLEKRKEALQADTARSFRDDTKAFRQSVLGATNDLFADGIIPADTQTIFQSNLDALLLQHEDFLKKLVGKGKLAESIIGGLNVQAFRKALDPLSDAFNVEMDKLSRAQSRISAAQARGSVTAAEADAITTEIIRAQIPLQEQKLRLMEQQFDLLRANPAVPPQVLDAEAARIDTLRLNLERLRDEQSKTAKSINESISGSIGTALENLTTMTGSVGDIARGFLFDIANSIRKMFVEDLSTRIARSLGADAAGGIGGFLSKILAGGPTGTGVTAVPGVAGAAAGSAGAAAQASAATLATTALGTFSAALAAVPATIALPFAGMGLAVDAVLPALGGLFIAAEAAAAALMAMATQQTAKGIAALVAHTGGVIGSSRLPSRVVHPSLFAGARRYHSGGGPGLQSNEVPTILQKAEQVLTENQQNTVDAALSSKGGSQPINLRNVLVTDPNFVPDAMASSQGERVLTTFIQRNRASIKQILS